MRIIFCFLVSLLFLLQAKALVSPIDTSPYEVRSFDQKKIDQYKKAAGYDYGTIKKKRDLNMNFWNGLIRFIQQLLGSWSEITWPYKLIRVIIYVLGAIIFLYFIISSFRLGQFFNVRNSATELAYDVHATHIDRINFEQLIQEAEQAAAYRLAIRLRFLQSLKLLSDGQYIDWKMEKTNEQYMLELKDKQLRSLFVRLSGIFDWVWYGDFDVNAPVYGQYKELFEQFKLNLSKSHV